MMSLNRRPLTAALRPLLGTLLLWVAVPALGAPNELLREPQREGRENNEVQIQVLSSKLQAKCDEQRMELRREFLDTVFMPARREADQLLSLLPQEEKLRLDRNLKLIYSQRPEVREAAVAENREILRDLLQRRTAERGTEKNFSEIEWVPGTPFSSLRVVGNSTEWRSKTYRAEVSFSASSADSTYGYTVSVSGGPVRSSQEEIVEAALPLECRIFLTGLNKGALYVYPSQLPALKSYADLGDPNRALSALLDPFREAARNTEIRVYQAGSKPVFADTNTPDAGLNAPSRAALPQSSPFSGQVDSQAGRAR